MRVAGDADPCDQFDLFDEALRELVIRADMKRDHDCHADSLAEGGTKPAAILGASGPRPIPPAGAEGAGWL